MFGSWKPRGRLVHQYLWNEALEAEEGILSEVEEELSTFLLRQNGWKDLQQIKELPSWMKTASLNRQSDITQKGLTKKIGLILDILKRS